ncbi:MAG: CoA-binding protein, partial [Anaerolineales bacterium]|nr:CoA-binding protein [Anaerolineales bacterium]
MGLQSLIKPGSVAIVGATDKPGKFGYHAAANMLEAQHIDNVYFIHPKEEKILGRTCYRTLSDLPQVVDCAVLCTPKKTIHSLLDEAGRLGIPSAIVFASGFSEEGTDQARSLEAEMVDIATKYNIKVLGPNCLGIYNSIDDIYLWGLALPPREQKRRGGIGMVGQSGQVVASIIHTDYLNIAYGISTGNGNVVTLEDCVDFLVDDDSVRVVSIYLEGLKNPELFLQALKKAAEKQKPIVVLKAGRSERGAASAASHTGNLAGSPEVYDSVFAKYGVIQVEDGE